MGAPWAEIHEERLVRGDLLGIPDHLDGLLREVLAQVIPFGRRGRGLDHVVVIHEVRIPLVCLTPEEAVEPLEPPPVRPVTFGGGHVALLLRHEVPLTDGIGIVPPLHQHLGQRGRLLGDPTVRAREPRCRLLDAGHTYRGVVAPGEQARPGR